MALTWKVLNPVFPYRPLEHKSREIHALEHLVATCHPTRKPRPRAFWFAFPTYVIGAPDGLHLTGYSSVSVMGTLLQGMDMGVHPDYQRTGLGKILMYSRLKLAKDLGTVDCIVGQTQVLNQGMKKLFDLAGMTEQNTVEGYYDDVEGGPQDALIYAGDSSTWKEI